MKMKEGNLVANVGKIAFWTFKDETLFIEEKGKMEDYRLELLWVNNVLVFKKRKNKKCCDK